VILKIVIEIMKVVVKKIWSQLNKFIKVEKIVQEARQSFK